MLVESRAGVVGVSAPTEAANALADGSELLP